MDKQQIFNVVADHLLTQNRRSANEIGSCKYRGPDGTKCAVGILIPDDMYKRRMEGRDIHGLVAASGDRSSPEVFYEVPDYFSSEKEFLSTLQSTHDMARIEKWPAHLKEIALVSSLEVTPLLTERLKADENP